MGSVKRIRLKPHCIPSRFDLNRKKKSSSDKSDLEEAKRQKTVIDQIEENNMKALSSCVEGNFIFISSPSLSVCCQTS